MSAPHFANMPGQGASTNGKAESDAVLKLLGSPQYPSLALYAHVTGDVIVTISILGDRRVESVTATGPPLLKQAALESVEHSKFECSGCTASSTLVLKYSFVIRDSDDPCENDSHPVAVTRLSDSIMVAADPINQCEDISLKRVRSLKCLYLWDCGRH